VRHLRRVRTKTRAPRPRIQGARQFRSKKKSCSASLRGFCPRQFPRLAEICVWLPPRDISFILPAPHLFFLASTQKLRRVFLPRRVVHACRARWHGSDIVFPYTSNAWAAPHSPSTSGNKPGCKAAGFFSFACLSGTISLDPPAAGLLAPRILRASVYPAKLGKGVCPRRARVHSQSCGQSCCFFLQLKNPIVTPTHTDPDCP